MTGADFISLLPLLVTAYMGVLLMLIIAFARSARLAYGIALVSFAAALGTVFVALGQSPRAVTPLIEIDVYSLFFTGLALAGAFLVTLLSYDYFAVREKRGEAFYVLLMLAVTGMIVIASSGHFVSFFLGVETLSISLYGLIGYTRRDRLSLEAAVKYLVPAAASGAFLLFGIALIYAEFGTMDFRALAPAVAGGTMSAITLVGLAMVLVGFGYKLAAAPFHMWSPDVYQGAPAPVTALIATGSKGAVLALLLRLFTIGALGEGSAFTLIAMLCVASMFVGNLLALLQNNIKRILAYSSIAHIGYLLIPLLAGGLGGASSIAFYLVSYFATTIAAFGVIAVLSMRRETGDLDALDDYRGLAQRHPMLAGILALALLSLTGIPLTSGFIAKFYIFTAAVRGELWGLLIAGIVASGISAFYYLRVLVALYSPVEQSSEPSAAAGVGSMVSLAICTAIMVFFGVYPTPLIRLAEAATRSLGF